MTPILRAALLASAFALPAGAAEPVRPPPQHPPQVPKTAKERLSGKDSDEQRMDDCKVPPERRTRPRPTVCPWEFGR
ncbi:MAG: hypothetical protein ICV73_18745 [Acetobacteraceae bacterium]|nr:hypothetical protein [Acetobacteraceae bacterium]